MPEGIARHVGAIRLEGGHDLVDAGTLGDEDVGTVELVHDGPQSPPFGLEVEVELGHVHGVHVPPAGVVADARDELTRGEVSPVAPRGLRGEPAAVAAHDLVDDEHARAGGVLCDDVAGEECPLLGRSPGAEALPDRHDVVVDRLGQTDDLQLVALVGQVRREVCGRRARVVATDGVQHVDSVGHELVRRHPKGVGPLRHEAAPGGVGGIGQLDPGVAERGPTEGVQPGGDGPHLVGDLDVPAGEQACVPVEVADDAHVGRDPGVLLDECPHRRGEAGREPPGGEERDGPDRHEPSGVQGFWIVSAGRT